MFYGQRRKKRALINEDIDDEPNNKKALLRKHVEDVQKCDIYRLFTYIQKHVGGGPQHSP